MLTLSEHALRQSGRSVFLRRLDDALARLDRTWAVQARDERQAFLSEAWQQADALGLRSERGVAGYALAARWMGLRFEQEVPLLMALLKAPMPEVRKTRDESTLKACAAAHQSTLA